MHDVGLRTSRIIQEIIIIFIDSYKPSFKIARLTALSIEENDMVKRRELHDFSMSDLRMFSSSNIVTLNGYVDVSLFGEVIIYMCSL